MEEVLNVVQNQTVWESTTLCHLWYSIKHYSSLTLDLLNNYLLFTKVNSSDNLTSNKNLFWIRKKLNLPCNKYKKRSFLKLKCILFLDNLYDNAFSLKAMPPLQVNHSQNKCRAQNNTSDSAVWMTSSSQSWWAVIDPK